MAKEPKKEKMNFIHKITSILTGSCFHFHSVAPYLLALPLAIYLCFGSATLARAQEQQRALILQSYHIGFIWSDNVAEGIKSVLGKEKNVEIFFEYMDTKRHMGKPYLEKLLQLYKDKYGALSLDVIICSDDNALNFLLRNREDLFPGVPIVFCGINNFTDSLIAGYTNITGVVENPDILGTLQIALRLHPGTRQVAVVHDQSKSALANIARLRKIAPDFKEQVEFKYLTDMTISELREALRDLSAETVVLHLSFGRDRDGVFLSLREASKLVNNNSAGPVYTCWDVRMSYPGHCGGKVVSGYAQGEAAARLALRVLHGESANNIDIIRKSPNVYMFDYAQMNHFGLSKKDLPKDSIVVNKTFSFYEKYKGRIRITLGAFAFLLILISFLAVNIFRRKHAEEALQESEERFRALFEGAPDAIFLADPGSGKILDANPTASKLMLRPKEEIIGLHQSQLYPPRMEKYSKESFSNHARQKEEPHSVDIFVLRSDGSETPVEVMAQTVHIKGKPVLQGVFRDITERKQAEEKIKASLKEKEVLLREIHHRVKNNMQVIISLLSLQSDNIKDKQSLEMFKESQDRIRSMSLIHEKLYQSEDLANIDFSGYVKDLVNRLFGSYGVNPERIELKIEIEDVSVGLDYAIPCGLIINELVSNSLKYAFPQEGKGEIKIALRSVNEDELELTVSDDGIGIPEDLDFENLESLGLDLVKTLAEHNLDAKIELNRAGGTKFHIQFKKG